MKLEKKTLLHHIKIIQEKYRLAFVMQSPPTLPESCWIGAEEILWNKTDVDSGSNAKHAREGGHESTILMHFFPPKEVLNDLNHTMGC